MSQRKPFIYNVNRNNVTDDTGTSNDKSFVPNYKLYDTSETLPGISSIWGYEDDEYVYSSEDIETGYGSDIISSITLDARRIIFPLINSDSDVGPIHIYETSLTTSGYNSINDLSLLTELNTRLKNPFILESNSNYLWIVATDPLVGATPNIFRYFPLASSHDIELAYQNTRNIVGENYDSDNIILISYLDEDVDIEIVSSTDLSNIKSEAFIAPNIDIIKSCTRVLNKEANLSQWIMTVTDDTNSPTYTTPYLLNVDIRSGTPSTFTNMTLDIYNYNIHSIQFIDGYFYLVYDIDDDVTIVKSTDLLTIISSPDESINIGQLNDVKNAAMKYYDGRYFLLLNNTSLFYTYALDFSVGDFSKPYMIMNNEFNSFFTKAITDSSGTNDSISLLDDTDDVIRFMSKRQDTTDLIFCKIAGKVNTTSLPSNNILFSSNTRNLSTEVVSRSRKGYDVKFLSKVTFEGNFYGSLRKLQKYVNSRMLSSQQKSGIISIASNSSSDYLWVCLNQGGIIYLAKYLKSTFKDMNNKYYYYAKTTNISLNSNFIAVGKGDDAKITYNNRRNEILLTYFANQIYLGRTFDFELDPLTYFNFRRVEDGLIDLNFTGELNTSSTIKCYPVPAHESVSKFHKNPTGTQRHVNQMEDTDRYYHNFNFPYILNTRPNITPTHYEYSFERESDNLRDHVVRFLYFDLYIMLDGNEPIDETEELYRPLDEKQSIYKYKLMPFYGDPVKDRIYITNNASIFKDHCKISFPIADIGTQTDYYGKMLYLRPTFGIFTDPTLRCQVDTIIGVPFNSGVQIFPITKMESESFVPGTMDGNNYGDVYSHEIIYYHVNDPGQSVEKKDPLTGTYDSARYPNIKDYHNLDYQETYINKIKGAITSAPELKTKNYYSSVVF